MKIIISRKGFDSSSAGCPSPILPDGTMLSMPIPTDSVKYRYSDLTYKGLNYSKLISSFNPQFKYEYCHLDPDIRSGIRETPESWVPAFGQTGSAQSYLANNHIDVGDIFLFFGRFHRLDKDFRFIRKSNDFYSCSDLHIIYGFLQIGKIVKAEDIKNYPWHPHSEEGYHSNNTLYIPSTHLFINEKIYGDGCGVFSYDKKRVLTKEGCSCANWIPHECLLPVHICGDRKNSSKKDALYYAGQWQELVFDSDNNPMILDWLKNIL